MLFQPNLHTVVWGGDRICGYKGLDMQQKNIGESWEVSAVPTSKSIVSNGELAGRDLVSVVDEAPDEILGKAVSEKYNGQLPLLVKFIDSAKPLSIQVHPNDEMARREHGKSGKTEMWYVIDAQPGSFLYAGFKQEITPEEYKRRIADGTITDVLAKHEVKRGDVFYLPAGRVHAIGSGILLCEVQQSSDVTYRIYDYNRPGLDGKPRELHTELAAKAIDYRVQSDYRTSYTASGSGTSAILDTPFFRIRLIECGGKEERRLKDEDSFVILIVLSGECHLRCEESPMEVSLGKYSGCLIPAAIADFTLEGEAKILEAII